jgi:asparagine synthase (glutamine-hydrolysing)
MCGLAGVLTTRPELDLVPPLRSMQHALRHRGPDDEGLVGLSLPGGYRLGLAHTRLAILDLSPAGHQPMHDPASGSWIVYNGEIYNHQRVRKQLTDCAFCSTSDTETILKGWDVWGAKALDALRGMFALALYDGRRQEFWLVRDRLGVKPLYVCRVGQDTWLFASEVRALLASGLVERRLRNEAVESYLAFGAVTAPWTLLEGVESLLPGESWRFDLSREKSALEPEKVRYWRPTFLNRAEAEPSRAEALERLRPVLLDAVTLRMLSDVPVGVFLSGGIDSSSLVAVLTHQGYRIHTFSIVFGESAYDESDYSRLVARQFGSDHTEIFLRPQQVLEEFEEAMEAYDQPSIDGSNTYFLSQVTRQAGVKVALSGLGGDELFAGYPYFRWLMWLEQRWPRVGAWAAYRVLRCLAPRSTRTTKLGAILEGNRSPLVNYAICRQVMAAKQRRALILRSVDSEWEPLPPDVYAELKEAVRSLGPANAQSFLELSLYLANMLLRDTDQMSMAHALEVREPLLDHVLVETVAGLPGLMKIAPGAGSRIKGLLVDALPVVLPRPVIRRRKMGFVFPWEHWLRHELKSRVEFVLTNAEALQAVGLNQAATWDFWNRFLAADPGIRYTDILCLLNLLYWTRRHRLTIPA